MPQEQSFEELVFADLWNPADRYLYPCPPNKGGEAKELSFRTPSWERHWQKLVHFWNSRFVTDPKGDGNSDHPSRKGLLSNRYNKPDGIPECKEMSPYEQKDAPESRFVNFIFWLLDAGEKNVKKSKKMLRCRPEHE